jgi:DtxR family transcriptional regulator, Mn-dependent transcriptional regulator
MTDEISPAMQQYLEVILDLSIQKEEVGVAEIAQLMNITKSSVSQALDMLKQQSLISHPRYGKVFLTPKGREWAERIRHKHDVLTYFFAEVLKVDRATAEKDACKIEHIISWKTFQKLVDFIEACQTTESG